MIGAMCADGRPPRMSIPARPDEDEDIVISDAADEAADLIEQQAARIKELEKDAERYRFLRDVDPDAELPAASVHKMNDWGKWCYLHLGGDELDAAIDAAMEADT